MQEMGAKTPSTESSFLAFSLEIKKGLAKTSVDKTQPDAGDSLWTDPQQRGQCTAISSRCET
jgi:hypothetical protein